MTDSRKALFERFKEAPRPQGSRRMDFKGFRERLNLRIAEAMAVRLRIIKLVTGESKNAFCERVLKEAVDTKIGELKATHGEEAWEAIERCAQTTPRSEPGG